MQSNCVESVCICLEKLDIITWKSEISQIHSENQWMRKLQRDWIIDCVWCSVDAAPHTSLYTFIYSFFRRWHFLSFRIGKTSWETLLHYIWQASTGAPLTMHRVLLVFRSWHSLRKVVKICTGQYADWCWLKSFLHQTVDLPSVLAQRCVFVRNKLFLMVWFYSDFKNVFLFFYL